MKLHLTFCLAITIALSACRKEERLILDNVERVLPGSWEIESFEISGHGSGVTYDGVDFYHDTIMYGVGEIDISSFRIQELDLQNPDAPPVPCVVSVGNEVFPYQIDHIFISGEDAFGGFRSSVTGVDTIDTLGEQFLSSSRIFNNNYYIVVVSEEHVRLEKGNDREGHVIVLRRL
jgi:hypothetical protein